MFFYWQPDKESSWQEQQAGLRDRTIQEKRPMYVTVLDLETLVTDDLTADAISKIRYQGPLYFDFDSTQIEETIEAFHRFLNKLVERGVQLNQVRLFASGGKGFHVEVPQELFCAKPRPRTLLPHIYKEMAWSLFVNTMDMSVYSARKGRMWRVPNVKRENGRYKVPLTPAQALAMTADLYERLTSEPQPTPTLSPATLVLDLASLWATATAKVEEAAKRRRPTTLNPEIAKRWGTAMPPCAATVLRGEDQVRGGFNKAALQLALTAQAAGMSREAFVESCEGLVERHQSDSYRYNTPVKRRRALSEMFDYTDSNPCYSFSAAGLKSILPQGMQTPDLEGLEADELDETPSQQVDPETGEVTEGAPEYDSLTVGVTLAKNGIVQRTQEGAKRLSNVNLRNIKRIIAQDNRVLAYEADIVIDGDEARPQRQMIPLEAFGSRASMAKFLAPFGGQFLGTDTQVQGLARQVHKRAILSKDEYLVSREGLDVIDDPENPGRVDVIWVSPTGAYSSQLRNEDGERGIAKYRFRSSVARDGVFRSDLHKCPPLEADAHTERVLDALLHVYGDDEVVAKLVGWMVSAFHRQIYHRVFQEFPLCGVFGQAGSGKSTLVDLLIRLFYWKSPPIITQACTSTRWGVNAALLSSASIPVVLEEYKPRQMPLGMHGFYTNAFRSAYNAQAFMKGGMGDEVMGLTHRDVRLLAYGAPVLYVGEAIESETAVMERTVNIALSKSGLRGQHKQKDLVNSNRDILSSLGVCLLQASEMMNFELFEKTVMGYKEQVRAGVSDASAKNRPISNAATILTGLHFLSGVLDVLFKGRFTARIEELQSCILATEREAALTPVMAEASKVLHSLALMTQMEDGLVDPSIGLIHGTDYHLVTQGDRPMYLDLKMRNAYVKYVTWCRRRSFTPLYDNEESFLHGLTHYAPMIDGKAMDSVLKQGSPFAKVFRFDIDQLTHEGVDPFKTM